MKSQRGNGLEVAGIIVLIIIAAVFFVWLFHQTSSNAEKIVRNELAVPGYWVTTAGYTAILYGSAIFIGLAVVGYFFFREDIAIYMEGRWRRKVSQRTDEIIRASGYYLPLFTKKNKT